MVATFAAGDGLNPVLKAAHRESGASSFEDGEIVTSSPIAYGATPGIPFGGLDPEGNAATAWIRADGALGFAGADGAGPRLLSLTVPQSAVAGEAVSLSVSPFDLWSGLDVTSWSFGDGRSATGTSVQHTFAAPGTYMVQVTSADLAGQSTSTTRTITVTAPPAPPSDDDEGDDETPKPPVVTPPVIEARLAGRTVTLNAKVALKRGKRCSGTVRATTAFGGRSYRTTLRLVSRSGACRATGTIKLKKTPSLRSKLRVTIKGSQLKTRTLTTRRG
jgi:PKD repeat protein